MPSRRQYLKASVGLVGVGFAGCLSGSESPEPETEDESTATTTATETPTVVNLSFGTETTVNEVTITPEMAHPQTSFFYVSNADWGAIERLEDEWVVFVSIATRVSSGTSPARDSFRLVAGDDEFAPLERIADVPLSNISPDEVMVSNEYEAESGGSGWVAFAIPEAFESASDLRLEFDHEGTVARWSLPDDVKARVGGPRPTFELVSFDGPRQVPAGAVAELSITARNTSSVDGVFRSCLNTTGLYAYNEISTQLEAGAEGTMTNRLPVNNFVNEPNSTFSCFLRTAETERELSIEVVPNSEDG